MLLSLGANIVSSSGFRRHERSGAAEMSSPSLPPLSHLPRWTRVGRLRKPLSPRSLPSKQQFPPPLPPPLPPPAPLTSIPLNQTAVKGEDRAAEAQHLCPDTECEPRVASLQRNIQFLQQQHQDTLQRLHAEIEHLRRQNKDLHYKLIMEPPRLSRKEPMQSQRSLRPLTHGRGAHNEFYLEEPLQDIQSSQNRTLRTFGGSGDFSESNRQNCGPDMNGSRITSLQPLQIHSDPSCPPRAPTLQECEVIIRQLYNANSLQSQELLRVKAVLRDIVLSRKISPENYSLTKGYLVDSPSKSEEKSCPKLRLQTYPGLRSGPPQSGIILPALKQSLSPTVAERQRRTRTLQKDRFKRTALN